MRTADRTGHGADVRPEAPVEVWLHEASIARTRRSSTQQMITRSSAEAELMAAVKAAAEGVGVVQMAEDVNLRMTLEIKLNSSAAHLEKWRERDNKLLSETCR